MLKLTLDGALRSQGLSRVQASVLGGRVTLTGSVPAKHLKRAAEDICRSVGATGTIVNRIQVRAP